MKNRTLETPIFRIRGQQVMLDEDLARLYRVSTKGINKAVQRNKVRFPIDFMFRISVHELLNLKFQSGTSSWGGRRYLPYAFTEQGIAMLSSVLRSERAALVNIAIMRTFVRLRRAIQSNRELANRVARVEGKLEMHESDIQLLLNDIKQLKAGPLPKRPIPPAIF